MALGAAKASGADIAVSVTGVAGPTGGDEVRPVGTVYLGAARDGVACVKKLFVSRPDRALVRAGPHRLRWNWRCVWHRAKSLPGRRPSPRPSSRTTKCWLHWMRRSSGKNQK